MKFFFNLYARAGAFLSGIPAQAQDEDAHQPPQPAVDEPKDLAELTAHFAGSGQGTTRPAQVVTKPQDWPLERTLLNFYQSVNHRADAWIPYTLGNVYEGVFVFGANGSGKSSGTGQYLAHAFLKAGFGGLVLCAKPTEAEAWKAYAKAAGREDDLVIFEEAQGHGFNFLQYELAHSQGNPAMAATAVLMELVGASSGGDDKNKFWTDAARRLIRNCLDACHLSGTPPTIALLHDLSTSTEAAQKVLNDAQMSADLGELKPGQVADLAMLKKYLLDEWPKMAKDTRSGILAHMTTTCDPFLTGTMRAMFTDHTTHTPDDILAGKIIVVNLPVKTYDCLIRGLHIHLFLSNSLS